MVARFVCRRGARPSRDTRDWASNRASGLQFPHPEYYGGPFHELRSCPCQIPRSRLMGTLATILDGLFAMNANQRGQPLESASTGYGRLLGRFGSWSRRSW